jgi:N-acetyl sugar amidotransferase
MMANNSEIKICTKGLWDTTVPNIEFDEAGVSNYYRLHEALMNAYPRGEEGKKEWESIISRVKTRKGNQKYDCIIGVSGGTDSSYLLYLCKEIYGLKPLAVNLDNGWNTDISVKNIKKVTTALNIDLETYVIDYEEMKDILRSYIKSGLPWIDMPTDIAIKAVLYKVASRENIKYVFRGNDFRTEGTQPTDWTMGDGRQLKYIQKKFGTMPLRTFPNETFTNLLYYAFFKQIKSIYPYYFLDYNKKEAQAMLSKKYGWEYYGGHHHENLFTKVAIAYWLPEKFSIDKRKITLSAQIINGEISREDALRELQKKPYDTAQFKIDFDFFLKKLDMSPEEFNKYWVAVNKTYKDYPSYYPFFKFVNRTIRPVIKMVFPYKPMSSFQAQHIPNN